MADAKAGNRVIIALDLETTGLNPERHEIIEMGAVRFAVGEESREEFNELVKPSSDLPAEVCYRTGIMPPMVENAAPITEVLPRFVAWCGPEALFAAHNAPFDAEFLLLEAERHGVELPQGWAFVDTLEWARARMPGGKSYSLSDLLKGIRYKPPGTEHRALYDAHGVAALLAWIWSGYKQPVQALAGRTLPIGQMAKPPATDKQLRYLRQLGAAEFQLQGLTRRKASELIDHYKGGSERRWKHVRTREDAAPERPQPQTGGCSSSIVIVSLLLGVLATIMLWVACLV